MSEAERCHLCRRPGAAWCPPQDRVGCNLRARRRLGIPYAACLAFAARDLEQEAAMAEIAGDQARAQRLSEQAIRWQVRADQAARAAGREER